MSKTSKDQKSQNEVNEVKEMKAVAQVSELLTPEDSVNVKVKIAGEVMR